MMGHADESDRVQSRRLGVRPFGLALMAVLALVWAGTATGSEIGEADVSDPVKQLQRARAENLKALEAIDSEAFASTSALEALERDLGALRSDQQAMEDAFVASAARRLDIDSRIAAGETSLTGLSGRQDTLRRSLIDRRTVLAEVLAALQRIGRDPPPALLVSPEDALASVRSAILLGAVVPGIRSQTEALARDLQELAELRRSIAVERQSLKVALAENTAEEERLSALASEKLALQAESERRLATERSRAGNLAERSAGLESLIARLETEIVSIREAAQATRKAEAERQLQIAEQLARARALAAATLPDKNLIAPAYAFSTLMGALSRPVDGETIRLFGAGDGTGNALKGEVVASLAGTPVKAPVDAWVAYAGVFRSYGKVIILDAGEEYHVVLAGMDRISVRTGQFVLAGEPVAVMGEARLAGAAALALVTDRPSLYIEFRRGGQPVDPQPWWKVDTSSGRASNDT